ncbi:hypothetical protein APSETT444_003856 [Aspergillus pseudonomiae]
MSFTRVAPRSLNAIVRSTATPTLRVGGVRSISATAAKQKGPVEAAKDTLKKTDDVLSGAAVKGIEKGEQVADAIKGAANKNKGELKGDAAELAGQGKSKAEETLGSAKGKTEETIGSAKGKAQETLGEAKGKAKETHENVFSGTQSKLEHVLVSHFHISAIGNFLPVDRRAIGTLEVNEVRSDTPNSIAELVSLFDVTELEGGVLFGATRVFQREINNQVLSTYKPAAALIEFDHLKKILPLKHVETPGVFSGGFAGFRRLMSDSFSTTSPYRRVSPGRDGVDAGAPLVNDADVFSDRRPNYPPVPSAPGGDDPRLFCGCSGLKGCGMTGVVSYLVESSDDRPDVANYFRIRHLFVVAHFSHAGDLLAIGVATDRGSLLVIPAWSDVSSEIGSLDWVGISGSLLTLEELNDGGT